MQDEKIFRIATITTIIGLIGVIVLTGFINPEHLTINQIDKTKMDKQVEITAVISNVTLTKSGTEILSLNDNTGLINLVIFPTVNIDNKDFNLYKNRQVTVVSKVTEYKGQNELILEEYSNLKLK